MVLKIISKKEPYVIINEVTIDTHSIVNIIKNNCKITPNLGYLKPENSHKNNQYKNHLNNISFDLFHETKDYIIIPYYFDLLGILNDNFYKTLYKQYNIEKSVFLNYIDSLPCFVNHSLSIRNNTVDPIINLRKGDQQHCFDICSNNILNCGTVNSNSISNGEIYSGIINLSTSSGKTVLSLAIIQKVKMKALILVNKMDLLYQWKDKIMSFLPSYSVGIIQGKIFDIENKDIVIGMVQTISSNSQIKLSSLSSFNIVFIDEVHSMPTKSFSKIFFKITAKYQFGLSATLNRADGLDKVFSGFLGPVIYTNINNNKKQQTEVLLYNSNIDCGEIGTIKLFGSEKPNMAMLINNISSSKDRNDKIIDIIIDIINKEGQSQRKILCMSDRISQLMYIQDSLLSKNIDVGLYIGSMKQHELQISRHKQIILATYQMVIQGFDEPSINTLLFLTPRSNIEQAIGRIYRKTHTEIDPCIIDIIDKNYSLFKNQAKKRKTLYSKKIDNVIFKTKSL